MNWKKIFDYTSSFTWWLLAALVVFYQWVVIPGMEETSNIQKLQTFMIGYSIGNTNVDYEIIPYAIAVGEVLDIDSTKMELVFDWYYMPEDSNASTTSP